MSITATDLDAVEKELYVDSLADVTFKNNVFLSLLKVKPLGTGGDKIPIRTAPPPGVSYTFSRAQANSLTRGSQFRAFKVTHKTLIGIATITGDQVYGTNTDAKAFASLIDTERRGLVQHMAKMLEVLLFRDGWGDVGVISSIASNKVTLTNVTDANNVEVGMEVVAAAAKATGNIRAASTNGAFVTGVNPSEGVLTFGAAVTDGTDGISTAVVAGDTLFIRGNRQEASSPAKLALDGLPSWLPGTDPGDESSNKFFDVDRNGNSRLYGLYLDATSLTWMELLVTADQIVTTNGGTMDTFIVSPKNFKNIQVELQGKIHYDMVSQNVTAKVNFKSIEVMGMNGQVIKVIASRGCKDTDAFGLDLSTWSLRCMHADPVDIYDADNNGMVWLRQASADGQEIRTHSRSQLACSAPGYNIRVAL